MGLQHMSRSLPRIPRTCLWLSKLQAFYAGAELQLMCEGASVLEGLRGLLWEGT